MEEYTQVTLDEWVQWKEDIRRKLAETADNFVYIGFRLKQIRDSGMFGGAADLFEFAAQEYGLSKSTVSRFIAINEKYSEGGNSLELREEFKGFSSSKLSEMLTLPDKEIELINEKTTIRAIRELKKFNTEDPEQAKEQEEDAERNWTPLEKCIIDFFEEKQDVLDQVMKLLHQEEPDYRQAAELMAPSGQAFHKKGVLFLFLYEWKDGVKYKIMASPDPVQMDWKEFLDTVYKIYSKCTPGQVAREFYGAEGKDKKIKENQDLEPVATSQQKEEKQEEKEQEEKRQQDTEKDSGQESEGWEDAHPESITSLCYSCKRYMECNVKTGTCKSCDRYINKAEAEKTDEQRYSEEQAAIDRKTRNKLREMEQEAARQQEDDAGQQEKERCIRVSKEMYGNIVNRRIPYMIVREEDKPYKEKDILTLIAFHEGRSTGDQMRVCVTCADNAQTSSAIMEGYAVIGVMDIYDAEDMGIIDIDELEGED